MAFIDDLKSLAVAAGVSAGVIFRSTKANIPTGEGPYTSLIATGGPGSERIQNNTVLSGYEFPTAQVLTRAASYDAAWSQAMILFRLYDAVRNRTINGVWYRSVKAIQSVPRDLAEDNTQRAQVTFDVIGDKSPS